MTDKIKVMLSTEGTYPFHHGGVSTWCDILVNKLTEVDYTLYSIIMNPFVNQKFELPKSANIIKVPLWGTEEPSEHLSIDFSQVYIARKRTIDSVVKEHFIPLFRDLIDEILSKEKNSERFANILLGMHHYFKEYEYKSSFKSHITWDVYKNYILELVMNKKNRIDQPSIYSMIQSLGWIYRFLNILNTPVPKVDVSHSAAAAFCGIPCVLAKLLYKTPFLLTEHGVYLREQYLSLSKRGYPSFLNTFLIRFILSVTNISYKLADQVSPVCEYNMRWEKKLGLSPKKIEVIYNGVDKEIFSPLQNIRKNKNPTVVSVARIDPIKDLLTLINAARLVKNKIPEVKFVVYGSVTVPEYYEQCISLIRELDLEATFIFAGHTSDVPSAYRSGDIIALSSISEGFPYSVVEAMMVGKAVIATDVGGMKEALGDCGLLVRPRQPEEMAKGIITLLEDSNMRTTMGQEARSRALNNFSIERVLKVHLKSYRKLIYERDEVKIIYFKLMKQKLIFDKGCALFDSKYYKEAILQFRLAIMEEPTSAAIPVIFTKLADAYNNLGNFDHAFNELEKIEAYSTLLQEKQVV